MCGSVPASSDLQTEAATSPPGSSSDGSFLCWLLVCGCCQTAVGYIGVGLVWQPARNKIDSNYSQVHFLLKEHEPVKTIVTIPN